jgi:hypothetical protein
MAAMAANSLIPPFTRETAVLKVRKAEDGWNSRDPEKVALAYTVDSQWRNRSEFLHGRQEIIEFLRRFAYEWHDEAGKWCRSYGNENWEFDTSGIMHHRHASINDVPIEETDRLFHWPLGRRPDDHPGLSALGL